VNDDSHFDGRLSVIPNGDDSNKSGFLIPFDTKDFGQFLAGLLKTPKKTRLASNKPFKVDLSALADITKLVDYRFAEQQEHSQLTQDVDVYYADGTSHHFASLNELAQHRDLTDSSCRKLTLTLAYLVSLPDSKTPAKQEIQFSFDVDQRLGRSIRSVEDHESRVYTFGGAAIEVSILHTHVSLGNDLANLIRARLKKMEVKSSFSNFMSNFFVQFFWTGAIFVGGLGLAALASSFISSFLFSDITRLTDLIQSGSLTNSLVLSSFIAISFAITFLMIGIFTGQTLAEKPRSFIVLSEQHEINRRAAMKSYGNRWIIYILGALGSLTFGIVTSLIATGIWSKLWG
jgi:hypothetical protein